MKAGQLDRRVQFLRSGEIDDGVQVRPGPFAQHGNPVWASKRPVSDGERFRSDQTRFDGTDRFQIRWSTFAAGITTKDRLVCEGATYAIAGLKEIGRREGVEITASRIDP